jgi:hypothetical protein
MMQRNMPDDKPAIDAETKDASAAPPSPSDAKAATTTTEGEPMEIHAPDKPIHSKKEFMFHMLTVVLGILIALALDSIVTWAHHRILVREAGANIATELRNNKETIEKAVPEIQARQKQLQAVISTIDEIEKSRKVPTGKIKYSFASYELYSTAWKTASVSGAVTHMEYEQLKDYTDAYDLQQDFLTVQSQGFSSVGNLAAAMHVLDQDIAKVSKERLEDIQRETLKILTIQKTLENVSAGLISAYDKALK